MNNRNLIYCIMLLTLFLTAGCSNGSGTSSTKLSGVAAAGAPVSGTVYLKDSANPAKELSMSIASDGSFLFDLNGLTAPFLLKSVGTVYGKSITLYSFAAAPGIANLNPLSSLSLADASGSDNLAGLYNSPSQVQLQVITARMSNSVAVIQTTLQPTLTKVGASNVNFLNEPYESNHQGLDLLFDMIDFSAHGGLVTIVDRTDNSHQQLCLSNLKSASIDAIAIPVPAAGSASIWPTSYSMEPNQEITFTAVIIGATNQQVSWSVVEDGGGTVSSSGLYRAPDTPGIYHVKATNAIDASKSATATVSAMRRNVLELVPSGPGTFDFQGSNLIKLIGIQLSVGYDTSKLNNPQVIAGALASGATLTADTSVSGVLVLNVSGNMISGSGSIATIGFSVQGAATGGITGGTMVISETTGPATSLPSCSGAGSSIPASVTSGGIAL